MDCLIGIYKGQYSWSTARTTCSRSTSMSTAPCAASDSTEYLDAGQQRSRPGSCMARPRPHPAPAGGRHHPCRSAPTRGLGRSRPPPRGGASSPTPRKPGGCSRNPKSACKCIRSSSPECLSRLRAWSAYGQHTRQCMQLLQGLLCNPGRIPNHRAGAQAAGFIKGPPSPAPSSTHASACSCLPTLL